MTSAWFLILLVGCSLMVSPKAPESAKGTEYKIRFKAPHWIEKDEKLSDYIWENEKDGRILLSNSFCKEFQDQPLDVLANKTFKSVDQLKINKKAFTTFYNREAYQLEGRGTVDGVSVSLMLLNTRRNNCYFDFVSITPLKSAKESSSLFEDFLSSVEFK